METIHKRHRVPLLVAGGALALLVGAAIIVAANREPARYDPATPEGAVQGYLRAVLAGDEREAIDYLSEDLQDQCRREIREMWVPEAARAVLDETVVAGDVAEVDVTITETPPPSPLPETGFDIEVTFVMTRVDGGWAISEAPWPMYHCDGRDGP